jgi:succinate dehydrogenase / fumarate reductase cytochrome b subunit
MESGFRGNSPPARTHTRVFAAHPQVTFWSTVVGKKVVMAVTGAVLVGFVIGHILGNLQIFTG